MRNDKEANANIKTIYTQAKDNMLYLITLKL